MKSRIGIENLSIFRLPPVEFVNLAADLGCHYISTALFSIGHNPHGFPDFSLKDDPQLRRDMIAAMRDRDVSISLGEGMVVMPGIEARDRAEEFDLMAELGAARINIVGMEPDSGRNFDQFAILAEMSAAVGIPTTVEFATGLTPTDLPTTLALIRHVGRKDFRLLVDTMHLIRSGSTAADIAALDPELIAYCQLSDVPLNPSIPDYMEEAMGARLPPGKGELPLLEILKTIPRDRVISLEIPMLAEAEKGIGAYDRLLPCVERTRQLLAELDTTH